jgi:hypothetical protein
VSKKTQTLLQITSRLVQFTPPTMTEGKSAIKWDTFWCSPINGNFSIQFHAPFLGAFAKFQKATITFVISACRMKQLGSRWADFHVI